MTRRPDGELTESHPTLHARMSGARTALANIVAQYFVTGLSIVSGLLLVPYYLTKFDLATYGVWLACASPLAYLAVLDGGIGVVFARETASHAGAGRVEAFATTVGAGLATSAASGILVAVIGLGLAPMVPRWVGAPISSGPSIESAFALAVLGTAAWQLSQILSSILLAWQEPLSANAALLVATAGSIAATVLGLANGMGIRALGLAVLVRGTIAAGWNAAAVVQSWRRRRLPRPSLHLPRIVQMGSRVAQVIPGRALGMVLGNSEPLIVSVLLGPAVLAQLVLTGRLYTLVGLFLGPVGASAFSTLVRLGARGQVGAAGEAVRRVVRVVGSAAAVGAACALAVNSWFVALWVGADQYLGHAVDLVLAMATVVTTANVAASFAVAALGALASTSLVEAGAAGARVLISLALIPAVGPIGAPVAALLAAALVGSVGLRGLYVRHAHCDPPEGFWTTRMALEALGFLALGQAVSMMRPRGLDGLAWFVAGGGITCAAMLLAYLGLTQSGRTLVAEARRLAFGFHER